VDKQEAIDEITQLHFDYSLKAAQTNLALAEQPLAL
jgi:hypothetical protein